MNRSAGIVICGAGITGVAAAYYLSKAGAKDILLIDECPPLSLTSDHSTECYRNWWPDAAMLALMNRSIDLMEVLAEQSGNVFRMNRRGYLYVTGDESKVSALIERSKRTSSLGGGPIRTHQADNRSNYQPAPAEGYQGQPIGADLLLGSTTIRKHYPHLTDRAVAALHVRRAGWLSAQQLGMLLLESARRHGVKFEEARVASVEVANDRVRGVRLGSGETVQAPIFINAAGPHLREVGKMLGVDLPVHTELHLKAAIRDALGVVDRKAPLLIWHDPQLLTWDPDERQALAGADETRWLTEKFPSGVHTRPEGSGERQTI
jgi:glycine/D-amino acid oxidase-like deaminating enzyme